MTDHSRYYKHDLVRDVFARLQQDDKVKTKPSLNAVEAMVDAAFESLADAVGQGRNLYILHYLVSSTSHMPARQGRNPATGKPLLLPARRGIRLRAGKRFKDAAAQVGAPHEHDQS